MSIFHDLFFFNKYKLVYRLCENRQTDNFKWLSPLVAVVAWVPMWALTTIHITIHVWRQLWRRKKVLIYVVRLWTGGSVTFKHTCMCTCETNINQLYWIMDIFLYEWEYFVIMSKYNVFRLFTICAWFFLDGRKTQSLKWSLPKLLDFMRLKKRQLSDI